MTYQKTTSLSTFSPVLSAQPVACFLCLQDRSSGLLIEQAGLLRDCIAASRNRWPFEIEAAVILPAHMQMLAVFESSDIGIRRALAAIQSTFERHAPVQAGPMWDGPATVRKLDWGAVALRTTFIEAAPVRGGLAAHPSDWKYSTAYRRGDRNDDRAEGAVA